ncbi:MAG: hypothetical protein K0Q43_4004 [Ramlibacter sp.]|nr:hypothetical protein [Ramlibacter sp.]
MAGPLDGIKVLELGQLIAGPFARRRPSCGNWPPMPTC